MPSRDGVRTADRVEIHADRVEMVPIAPRCHTHVEIPWCCCCVCYLLPYVPRAHIVPPVPPPLLPCSLPLTSFGLFVARRLELSVHEFSIERASLPSSFPIAFILSHRFSIVVAAPFAWAYTLEDEDAYARLLSLRRARAHTHTHSLTHKHTHTHTHSLTHSLTLTRLRSIPTSLAHFLAPSRSFSLSALALHAVGFSLFLSHPAYSLLSLDPVAARMPSKHHRPTVQIGQPCMSFKKTCRRGSSTSRRAAV
mmetsp:Transcript_25734/g.53915  ORF Transcript_25734/g.53915 Transcript_25734/m.53915 type:complete len:252 (+) Transcript_25734:1119-1874(+)